MHRFNLPYHKRCIFHKRIGINIHRKVWLVAATIMIGLLMAAGEEYWLEHNLRLTRENEVLDLAAAQLKPPLGAPGTTLTDWNEGTVELKVRKP